jgi:hypothetical protein
MIQKWVTRILKGILGIFILVVILGALGEGILQLWNWLLPPLFGWRAITFWQAVGLLVLCRILFGHFGGRPLYRSNFRRRMAERWEHMTPEEREKFRHGMRGSCGHFGGAPAAEPKA